LQAAAFFVSLGLAVSSFVVPWVASTANASPPLSGSTLLDASASNATSVELRLFGGIYGFNAPVLCTATPTYYGWLCSWNTATVPNGSYFLASEAFNSAGSGFSSGVSITITRPITAYVATEGDDTVTPIDTVTNTAGTPIPGVSNPSTLPSRLTENRRMRPTSLATASSQSTYSRTIRVCRRLAARFS
jgi:hypothetical protein